MRSSRRTLSANLSPVKGEGRPMHMRDAPSLDRSAV